MHVRGFETREKKYTHSFLLLLGMVLGLRTLQISEGRLYLPCHYLLVFSRRLKTILCFVSDAQCLLRAKAGAGEHISYIV